MSTTSSGTFPPSRIINSKFQMQLPRWRLIIKTPQLIRRIQKKDDEKTERFYFEFLLQRADSMDAKFSS
jgi:hypothetical protein